MSEYILLSILAIGYILAIYRYIDRMRLHKRHVASGHKSWTTRQKHAARPYRVNKGAIRRVPCDLMGKKYYIEL